MRDKKAQINTLAPAILAIVFAGIVLVFGVVMSQELRDTQEGKETSETTSNATFTFTGSGITSEIAGSDDCGYGGWNSTWVINGSIAAGTNETLVEGTEYSVNANGSLMNITHLTIVRATYTSTWGGFACEGANATVVGLGTFSDFWEIIVLAIVITIVIGLLLVIFGGSARRR